MVYNNSSFTVTVSGSGIQEGLAGQSWPRMSHLATVRWELELEQQESWAAEGWLGISLRPLRVVPCGLASQHDGLRQLAAHMGAAGFTNQHCIPRNKEEAASAFMMQLQKSQGTIYTGLHRLQVTQPTSFKGREHQPRLLIGGSK